MLSAIMLWFSLHSLRIFFYSTAMCMPWKFPSFSLSLYFSLVLQLCARPEKRAKVIYSHTHTHTHIHTLTRWCHRDIKQLWTDAKSVNWQTLVCVMRPHYLVSFFKSSLPATRAATNRLCTHAPYHKAHAIPNQVMPYQLVFVMQCYII